MTSPLLIEPTPARLLAHRPFALFLGARTFSEFSTQVAVVALGWHVYALTGSAFDLGMIGLVQFLPMAVLVFIAGHAADRFKRQHVVRLCQLAEGVTAAFLAWGTARGWLTVHQIFASVAVLGVAAAFESPAEAALLPNVAPEGMMQRATALSTGAFQVAMISGPAVGGFAYAISPALPFAMMAAFWSAAALMSGAIRVRVIAADKEPPSLKSLFAGVAFVRGNPAILGTISLDLFAVLLGGATALLPIYARDILHTGPWGLGVLRAAPALGALMMTAYIAHHPITHRVGMRMFQAVIVFGAATAGHSGSSGYDQRRHTHLSGPARNPRCHARTRGGGELSLHQRLEPARGIRERNGGGAAWSDACRRARRNRDDSRRAAVDAAISVPPQRRTAGMSEPRVASG